MLLVIHPGDAEQRFWAKVHKTDTCWNWTAFTNRGYGTFQFEGKSVLAHRFAYKAVVGEIPKGMQVDHKCHNRRCVNPDHLRLATPKQNNENHRGEPRPGNTSGVRGVSWRSSTQRWVAQVRHNGQMVYARTFRNLEDAEAAVIAKRNQFHTFNDADRTAV